MKASKTVPNSIVFLYNPDNPRLEIPEWTGSAPYEANDTCVSVGTLAEVDGPATIELFHPVPNDLPPEMQMVYEGEIETPNKQISVNTSDELDALLLNVSSERSRVRVWVNRLTEPDRIMFAVA